MSTARVDFTRGAAERIANVVRLVEQGERDSAGLTFRNADSPALGKAVRICTFTGVWSVNASKTVTFKGVTSTPNTVAAVNLFCGMNPGTVACDIFVAKQGTAWYAMQPNLTLQPGYSSSGTQVLTIQAGVLRWLGTTSC